MLFRGAARLIVSPGVAVKTPAIAEAAARGVPIWGDIELLARLTPAPIAAITGTNGKSTVTALLGAMAEHAGVRAAVGGNLGPPALELWLRHERRAVAAPDIYVLELSSFQLETTHSLHAQASTVLNISPDHMDRYDSLEEYIAAKQRIFRGDGTRVVNADDPAVMAMVEPGWNMLHFTLDAPGEGDFGLRREGGDTWLTRGSERWIAAADLQISGERVGGAAASQARSSAAIAG